MSNTTATKSNTALITALDHAARGWYVFPCGPDKRPVETGGINPKTGEPYRLQWGKYATRDPNQVKTLWSKYPDAPLIGVFCKKSGIFVVDIDTKNGQDGRRNWTEKVEAYGAGVAVAVGPAQQTPSGGAHLIFKYPEGLKIPNNAGKLAPGLDLRSDGYICTGIAYTWLTDHGPDTTLTDAPTWLLELIRKLGERPAASENPEYSTKTEPNADPGAFWLNYYANRAAPGTRNECGFALACQLRDSRLSEAEARSIMLEYTHRVPPKQGDPYTEGAALASLQSAFSAPARQPATLPGVLSSNGRPHPEDNSPIKNTLPADQDAPGVRSETVEYVTGQATTDLGNAQRLVILHGADLHWIPEHAAWFAWNGAHWIEDTSGEAARRAQATARSILIEAYNAEEKSEVKRLGAWAFSSQNRGKLDAMLDLAKSQTGITIPITQFDSDPLKLNFLNGTLDLRSGSLRAHNPIELLSKQIQLNYDPKATCPLWLKFLDEIMDHGQEIIAYLRRCIGYSLTGETGEQCLFVCHGKGANGKTVFTRTILGAMGDDYALNSRAEAILARDRHAGATPDLARLHGARFVAINEIPSYARLDEARVKEMTGNDNVTARFLFADEFSFIPAFKLWISTNHKPVIKDVDEGIWRRMRLIPFTVTIPEDKQDLKLLQKLQAEWPGIIAWAVQGCLEWQAGGLQTPEVVRKATAEYRTEEDTLQPFFEDQCILDPDAKAGATDLYKAYKTWCEDTEEKSGSQTRFGRMMTDRGFDRKSDGSKFVYFGIGLKND